VLLQRAVNSTQTYAILFLVPVAFAGALLGLRGAYVTALIALLIERTVLNRGVADFASTDDVVRFLTLTVCMFIVASVTGCLRTALQDLDKLNHSLVESEERRLNFNREVLLAVTAGRLILCDDAEIQTLASSQPLLSMTLSEPRDVGEFRRHLREVVRDRDMTYVRLDELEVCATEAATNAIKHGNGGVAEIRVTDKDVSLLISDRGTGISPSDLARATLERGFSTRVSLGMGFTMMLETADKLALSTSPTGTTIFLQCLNTHLSKAGWKRTPSTHLPATANDRGGVLALRHVGGDTRLQGGREFRRYGEHS
jgi:anti-sigma regulatory factor (Ser/Thr protein kinase)